MNSEAASYDCKVMSNAGVVYYLMYNVGIFREMRKTWRLT